MEALESKLLSVGKQHPGWIIYDILERINKNEYTDPAKIKKRQDIYTLTHKMHNYSITMPDFTSAQIHMNISGDSLVASEDPPDILPLILKIIDCLKQEKKLDWIEVRNLNPISRDTNKCIDFKTKSGENIIIFDPPDSSHMITYCKNRAYIENAVKEAVKEAVKKIKKAVIRSKYSEKVKEFLKVLISRDIINIYSLSKSVEDEIESMTSDKVKLEQENKELTATQKEIQVNITKNIEQLREVKKALEEALEEIKTSIKQKFRNVNKTEQWESIVLEAMGIKLQIKTNKTSPGNGGSRGEKKNKKTRTKRRNSLKKTRTKRRNSLKKTRTKRRNSVRKKRRSKRK
tara:strand:- start:14036 stop:15073 length:1038 start_codon:yes stop_codon:yes gene_type:complete